MKVANLHYARTIDLGRGMGDDTIQAEFQACREWYRFFGFDHHESLPKTRTILGKHQRQESQMLEPALPKRTQQYFSWTFNDIMFGMTLILGENPTYRSREQEKLLDAILSGESQVIGILPTGGGKSLAFMLPACHRGAFTTIVVLPLVALKQDIVRKC